MSGRDAVRMTPEETEAFLTEHLKVQVATNGADGVPHLTTLFYVMHEGQIAFWTYGKSQKIRNLERDPRVAALVEDGEEYAELRGVSVRARATLVRDTDQVFAIGARVAAAMSGVDSLDDLGDLGRQAVERQAQKRVGVLVPVEDAATWDHGKAAG